MFTIKKWCEINNFSLQGKTFIIQGFGNVGYQLAKNLEENGMRMITMDLDVFYCMLMVVTTKEVTKRFRT